MTAAGPGGIAEQPLVAVCMATYEPDRGVLEAQVESIRRQTHSRFVCLVNDDASGPLAFATLEEVCGRDERFVVARNPERVGFYRNFERCLSRVPPPARYVALADQDDRWHDDKLATLVEALEGGEALLVYADMTIVGDDGRVTAPSYWTDRRNNFTDLETLLLANTVTGAASLLRREVLDDALPFPPAFPGAYHDHWLACVALASGHLTFVPRALHDYVQHGRNVVGSHVPPAERGGLANALRRVARDPVSRIRRGAAHSRGYYEDEVLWREGLARELERRLSWRLSPAKARAVHRIAGMSRSPGSFARLLVRSALDPHGEGPGMGIELQLAKGIAWHWQREARVRLAAVTHSYRDSSGSRLR